MSPSSTKSVEYVNRPHLVDRAIGRHPVSRRLDPQLAHKHPELPPVSASVFFTVAACHKALAEHESRFHHLDCSSFM
jgi:hypothetical protein